MDLVLTIIQVLAWILLSYIIYLFLEKYRILEGIFPAFSNKFWKILFSIVLGGFTAIMLPYLIIAIVIAIIAMIIILMMIKLFTLLKYK